MLRPSPTACLVFALLGFPAAAQESAPVAFGDWTGLCVASHCSLSAFAGAGAPERLRAEAPPAYRLSLLRRPGSPADELIFTPVGGAVQPGSTILIRVDGAVISRLGPSDGWNPLPDGAPNEVLIAPSIFQIDLLPRMLRGAAATVEFTGDDGRLRTANFSLKGLSAGEVWLTSPR